MLHFKLAHGVTCSVRRSSSLSSGLFFFFFQAGRFFHNGKFDDTEYNFELFWANFKGTFLPPSEGGNRSKPQGLGQYGLDGVSLVRDVGEQVRCGASPASLRVGFAVATRGSHPFTEGASRFGGLIFF